MGIWHHRIIDTQKSVRTGRFELPHFLLYRAVDLSPSGELALSKAPYTLYRQFGQDLYQKDHISLAVDGKVSHIDNCSGILEYIVGLYRNYGSRGLYRLEGEFSLILYDEKKQLTLLYRTFLNGNPLYFVNENNLLSVSTNPLLLLRRPDVSDALDKEEIHTLFTFDFPVLKGNIFSGLTSVQSGEMVTITPKYIKQDKRSLREVFVPEHYGTESEIIKKYRSIIEQTVHNSLLPDTEHGIMLSSGMDSSTVAVFAKQFLEKEKRILRAYSWILPGDTTGDESEKIKELCKALDIPLKLFNGENFGPFDALDDLLLLPDTPYTNPYLGITAETYRHASNDGIGAILNGGYGDMLYGGRYNVLKDILRDKRFELFLPEVRTIIEKMGYKNAFKKSPALRGMLRQFIPDVLLKARRRDILKKQTPWLSKQMHTKRRDLLQEEGFERFSLALSPFQAGYLGMDRYVSGQYGIKRIDPYIDAKLLNYTLNMPSYMTYREGVTKYFAREAMQGLLPESIRTQPRVGLLTNLFYNSYDRNKNSIRERLLDDRKVWKEYVNETWMENKLNSDAKLDTFHLLVFWLSLNMQQWQKAIKPGGSLYEGKFNSIEKDIVI